METKFNTGRLMMSANASRKLHEGDVVSALGRHCRGDWGDVCGEDRKANDWAVGNRSRILRSYRFRNAVKFWIITEADRSATTVLLPEDY